MSYPIMLNINNQISQNQFKYTFSRPVDLSKLEVALGSISIFYSWKAITAARGNNSFKLMWPTGTTTQIFTIPLPDGTYEASDINAYLQCWSIQNGLYAINNTTGQYLYYISCAANASAYAIQFTMQPYVAVSGYTLASGALPVSMSGYTPQLQITDTGAPSFSAIIGFAQGPGPLKVDGIQVVPPPSYWLGITEGSAAASKALVLNSTLDVSGINSLSAASLTSPLQTASQANITSLGTLTSITTSGALTMSGVSISSAEISVLDGVSPGTAAAAKALVLNTCSNISGIASLSATSLTGTLQTAAQPNITSVGTLTSLTVSGGISGATTIGASGVISLSNNTPATASNSAAIVITGGIASRNAYMFEYLQLGGTSLSGVAWGTNVACLRIAAATYIDNTSSGTVSSSVMNSFARPTLTANSFATYTTSATLYIAGSPIEGANITITKPYSLWIASGAVLFANTTASSPTTTGALVVSGGVGVGGTVSATSLSGTIQTAAQPNITSIGTLSNLDVSGSISGTLSTAAQPHITSVGTLSSLSVSGSLTGTLSTAAQPDVTSVGTLSSLSVSGVASITNTTYATSPSNGALVVSGGIGITKNIYIYIGSSQTIASWATTGPQIATVTATYTNSSTSSGGTAATAVMNSCAQCTLAATNTGVITTRAATVYISGAPIAGTNMTITNPYALLVASGRVLLDGAVSATSLTPGTLQVSGGMSVGENLYCSYMNTSTGICIHETAAKQTSWLTTTGSLTDCLDGSYSIVQDWYGGNVTPIRAVLEVNNGSSATSTNAVFFGSSTDNDLKLGTNNATRMSILGGTNAGRVGIGTISPACGLHNTLTVSTTLDAAGTGVAYFLKSGGLVSTLGPLSAIPVGIGTVGAILAGSGVYTTSDARIKKDFTKLYDYVADAMLGVEPLLFRYKSDDDTIPLQLGYKAQDLKCAGLVHY
ncbi:unnamed protein product [Phytophthora fragariaefolia]|uniref:Unnamed protein product n=1 Tax=Phytophthora fragariaefolia TaxID=1490495 RepID=A0A9W6XQY0_9STRA|nr:unnamed protein product [Phytophthora fragariaefolia]